MTVCRSRASASSSCACAAFSFASVVLTSVSRCSITCALITPDETECARVASDLAIARLACSSSTAALCFDIAATVRSRVRRANTCPFATKSPSSTAISVTVRPPTSELTDISRQATTFPVAVMLLVTSDFSTDAAMTVIAAEVSCPWAAEWRNRKAAMVAILMRLRSVMAIILHLPLRSFVSRTSCFSLRRSAGRYPVRTRALLA